MHEFNVVPFVESQLQLRHNGEGKIIPVAAFVAGLEIVAVDRDDAAIGQVGEGARNRRCRGVLDQRQDHALGKLSLC